MTHVHDRRTEDGDEVNTWMGEEVSVLGRDGRLADCLGDGGMFDDASILFTMDFIENMFASPVKENSRFSEGVCIEVERLCGIKKVNGKSTDDEAEREDEYEPTGLAREPMEKWKEFRHGCIIRYLCGGRRRVVTHQSIVFQTLCQYVSFPVVWSHMSFPVNKLLCQTLGLLGFPVVWEVSVGSVLFRLTPAGKREYLILQYPSGHFDFPKGHIEAKETEEDTLRRETEEETGIRDVYVYPNRASIRYFYKARGNEYERRVREGRGTWIFKVVHFYPAQALASTDVAISHEHIGSVWLPFDRALEKVTFDNAKQVLAVTEEYLKKHGG